MKRKPLIIVLSGAYGVGKTTLAHQLSIDLQIMHKLGLSAITKTVKTFLPKSRTIKKLYDCNKEDLQSVKTKLLCTGKLVGKVIHNIVNHAEETGENYIIDGTELLPRFLPMEKILFCYIFVSENKHKKRFNQPNITRMKPSKGTSYIIAKKISKLILNECKSYPIYKINNTENPKKTSRKIINMIKKAHPDYKKKYLWFEK